MKMLVAGRLAVRPVVPAPAPLQVGALYDAKRLSVAAQKFITAARVPLSRKARPN
jgi:hypothetical protein